MSLMKINDLLAFFKMGEGFTHLAPSFKYLDLYKIEGTLNLDQNPCFAVENTYTDFQKDLSAFQNLLKTTFINQQGSTFYKFGDGDFYFLKGLPVGSAKPGSRALSRRLTRNELNQFKKNARLADYYMCEIYPENRKKFKRALRGLEIDFPAEYVYALIANKWIFKEFTNEIGIIGADRKVDLIKELMKREEYQKYLGVSSFSDYIGIPQKFACDDLDLRLTDLKSKLENSTSKIFLIGVGHLKSGIISELRNFKDAIYLDVGSGIDALAGLIDKERPYFGSWINYRLRDDSLYEAIDYLQYKDSEIKFLD
jgi:hypothetical protein